MFRDGRFLNTKIMWVSAGDLAFDALSEFIESVRSRHCDAHSEIVASSCDVLATDYLESEEASPSGSLLRPHGYAGRAAPEDWLGSIFSGTDGVLFVASGDPASTAADEAIMRRSREVATAKGYDFDVLPLVVLRTSSGTRPASESAAALGIAGRPMVEDDVEKAHALLLAEIVRALAAGTLRHMPAPARAKKKTPQ